MHYLEALEKLKKGSKLYLECQSNPSIFHQELREELKNKGQKPYATIITCSDSRVPVQHIFSSSMGELFIIRNAGNVIGDFEIGFYYMKSSIPVYQIQEWRQNLR